MGVEPAIAQVCRGVQFEQPIDRKRRARKGEHRSAVRRDLWQATWTQPQFHQLIVAQHQRFDQTNACAASYEVVAIAV